MFAKLTGIIDETFSNHLILDVNRVGYLVFASNRTLTRIGDKGDPCSLLIETQVREDNISLFGFCDAQEKEWFSLLVTVQGVGAKAGLSILSACPPETLPSVIAAGDKAALTQADGVGPKLATRILTELKDKVDKAISISSPANAVSGTATVQTQSANPVLDDALSALVNLGYQRAEAYTALSKVQQNPENDNIDLSGLIKLGLNEFNKG